MELVKLSEAYQLTDAQENGFKATGQVIKEQSGIYRINVTVSKEDRYVGNYSYDIYPETETASSNYNCSIGFEDEFREYCVILTEQILEAIKV